MNYLSQLLIEAIFVGISLILIGNVVGFLVGKYYIKPELPIECANYNKYHIMEITLFLTGFLLHILFEISGLNKFYIKNGASAL
tara:strand:- start:8739 stop:8990 length:252 start_codon:yes stop_codon:yes gene_type:complete